MEKHQDSREKIKDSRLNNIRGSRERQKFKREHQGFKMKTSGFKIKTSGFKIKTSVQEKRFTIIYHSRRKNNRNLQLIKI